jgi:hypothetical protein
MVLSLPVWILTFLLFEQYSASSSQGDFDDGSLVLLAETHDHPVDVEVLFHALEDALDAVGQERHCYLANYSSRPFIRRSLSINL